MGHFFYPYWSVNPRYVLGGYIGGVPIEELSFFVCIPYACTFTYYCMVKYINFDCFRSRAVVISVILIFSLLITAVLFAPRLYTSVTFSLLSILLILLLHVHAKFLGAFYATFLLILIPFFVSNGILTGATTPEPVVIYNNNHNLGIRVITIPFEDTFYGMLLLLLNVAGYEWARTRYAKKEGPSVDNLVTIK